MKPRSLTADRTAISGPGLLARIDSLRPHIGFITLGLIVLTQLWIVSTPWRTHGNLLQYTEDDFFFYLKIAQNLAAGRGSTFDGVHYTNGYHPLWLLALTALSGLTTSTAVAIAFVAVTSLCATVFTYRALELLLSDFGLDEFLLSAIVLLACTLAIRIFLDGMETTLAIPLMLASMLYVQRGLHDGSFREGLILGLLLSFTGLARLDSLIWSALLLGALAWSRESRSFLTVAFLTGLAVGFVPVAIYFGVNIHYFGTLLPVSGTAKQLKVGLAPSLIPLRSILHMDLCLSFLFGALALFAIRKKSVDATATFRSALIATILFPFLYFAVLSIRSDWPLWRWYTYPFVAQLACATALVATILLPGAAKQAWYWKPVYILALCFYLVTMSWHTGPELAAASEDIYRFSATHPGTYAMGDRSGSVGYLLQYPVVQLEGLVMDKAYLDHIRNQEPLRTVLHEYGVRYYIATTSGPYHGVYKAIEPAKGGPNSPVMRATFTERPAAIFRHNQFTTLIYDLGR